MHTIRRLILVLLAVLLTAIVVALAYLHFANLNQYRDQISHQISTLTGQQVTIGELDVDLWPSVTVTTNNIAVANASWGSQPNMAEIGHLSASVRPMSLIFGPVLLQDFTLEDVSLLLEYDGQGKFNWSPAGEQEDSKNMSMKDSGSRTGGVPFMLENVLIRNVKLTRRQPNSPDQKFNLDNLTIDTNKEDQLVLAVNGSILDLPLILKGQLGTRAQLGDSGDGEFSLTGSLGDLQLETKGHLAISNPQRTTHIETVVSSKDVAAFIKTAGLPVQLSGPLTLKSDATIDASGLTATVDGSLSEFRASATVAKARDHVGIDGRLENTDKLGTMLGVANLPKHDITVKGDLSLTDDRINLRDITITTGNSRISSKGLFVPGDGAFSLQLRAKGDSLVDMMTNLPPLAFDGTVDLSLAPGKVIIEPLKLRIGSSDVAGNLRVVGTGSKTIKVQLVSKTLDLVELSAHEKNKGSESQDSVTKMPVKSTSATNRYVFSDDPLPFDQLQHSEADFDLSIDKLATGALTMNKVRAKGTLHKGILKGSFGFRTPDGGLSKSRFDLDASGKQASIQAHLDARDLPLKVLSGKIKDIKDIPVAGLTADLNSSGNSPRALAANSSGKMIAITGSGLIDNTIVANVSTDIITQLISSLNPFAKQDPYGKMDCGVIALDIKDGLSNIENFLIQNKRVTIVAAGSIDLKTEKLDIEFNTKPREGLGISADMFVTPFVALRGTLANPQIGLNKSGTLITLGAAFATGGLSMALQGGIDRASGETDQCKVILPKYPLPPLADD